MAGGRARRCDARRLRARAGAPRARRRLRMARPHRRRRPRPRLSRRRLRPPALDVLRRRDHARLAGTGARRRPRPDPARRAHEPPRRGEPRVAGARAGLSRRGVHHRRPRPLVPGSRDERHARARGRPGDLLPRALARRGGSRRRSGRRTPQKTADRVAVDIARLERFVARFRYKKSKAKQAQAKLTQIGRLSKEKDEAASEAALLTRRTRGLGFDFAQPKRSGRDVLVLEHDTVEVAGRSAARRRHVRPRARRPRRSRRPERERQDDAPGARGGRGLQAGPRRRGRLLLPARARAGRARQRARLRPGDDRSSPDRRRRRCSAVSSSPAGRRT